MSAPATTVIEKSTLPSLSRGGDLTTSNQPRMVKTIPIHVRLPQAASLAPMPGLVPVAAPTPQPSARVATRQVPSAPPADQSDNVVASAEPTPIAQTPLSEKKIEAVKSGARVQLTKLELVSAPAKAHSEASAPYAHDGWVIQIGAFDHEDEAKQHLSMAQLKMRKELGAVHPLNERFQKGDKVLYRARFTGFNKETADAVCQQLRRSDINCIALKN
jgi:D-alanyl-D-alanine carboxypeptidase